MVKMQVKGQGHQFCAKSTVKSKNIQSTTEKYQKITSKSLVKDSYFLFLLGFIVSSTEGLTVTCAANLT